MTALDAGIIKEGRHKLARLPRDASVDSTFPLVGHCLINRAL
jgi:hypothetical protein